MRRSLLIVGAQLADLAAFLLAARAFGLDGESNVLMASFAIGFGLPLMAGIKVLAAVTMAAIASRLRRGWGFAAALAGLAGALTAIRALA